MKTGMNKQNKKEEKHWLRENEWKVKKERNKENKRINKREKKEEWNVKKKKWKQTEKAEKRAKVKSYFVSVCLAIIQSLGKGTTVSESFYKEPSILIDWEIVSWLIGYKWECQPFADGLWRYCRHSINSISFFVSLSAIFRKPMTPNEMLRVKDEITK